MTDIRQLYTNHFDGLTFANTYINGDDFELKWPIEDYYHHLFVQRKLNGSTLIDVGSGPSLRAALSSSAYVSEIYLAEFVENNRLIAKKWLENAPYALDFSKMFKYVAKLEGKNDIKYLERRVRKRVKEVIFCDILADNPLSPRPLQQFDIVTSNFCLDCFPNLSDYSNAWKNLASLTRPGGHLVLFGTVNCTGYTVKNTVFPAPNINLKRAKKYIIEAGFKILESKEMLQKGPMCIDANNDRKGIFSVYAVKEK